MNTLLRLLLILGVATVPAAAQDVNSLLAGSFKGPLGLQLYSLRDSFNKDVPATLYKVKNFGFVDVELAGTYNETPGQFHEQLVGDGLKAIAGHFSYDRYKNDPEGVAQEAKLFGMKYAGCAWIPHNGQFTEKDCREAAAVFNHAGAVLASHGIKFYYHTHGYEFQPFADGTLFDLLMHETNPRYVSFEMDVMWVVFPGQDPTKLLYNYG
jgi:sugar phosphate isomerase/epimerase